MKKFNGSMYSQELAEKAKLHYAKMNLLYPHITEACVSMSTISDGLEPVLKIAESRFENTDISIQRIDTVSAIIKYGLMEDTGKLAALNFASFKHPGGMFLNGSRAQEEALCHESNLYNILINFEHSYYAQNKQLYLNNSLYKDRSIYTPGVLFQREDYAVFCDIITCAAPNKKAAMKYKGVTEEEANNALISRIHHVLNIAYLNKVDTLILGAFGCGVFGNDPYKAATIFRTFLQMPFINCFKQVIFAIPAGTNYEAFATIFRY